MLYRIKADLLTARKAKDKFTAGILGTLVSEGAMIGKDMGNRETTDAEMQKLILKFKKGANDTLELLGASIDNILGSTKENAGKCLELALEIGVYNGYLPTQLSEDEIEKEVGFYLQANDDKANIGSVMGHFRSNFDGQYDGKVLAKITNKVLKG